MTNPSVKQTNENSSPKSKNQPDLNPFKGRTLVRSAKPVQSQNDTETEQPTYANISVQYDYLDRGTSHVDEKKGNDSVNANISKGKVGAFNNQVDKKWVGGLKFAIFVHV